MKKKLIPITIAFFVFFLFFVFLIKMHLYENQQVDVVEDDLLINTEVEEEQKENIFENVYVDIKGAVLNPGVYEISGDKKVIDVVGLAGGFTEDADTSMINLAKKVTNEMVVIIYTKSEVEKASQEKTVIKYIDKECICPSIKNDACINQDKVNESKQENAKTNLDDNFKKVNLNTASLEELQTLNGIGEGKAKAIIEYREQVGSFKNIEELKEVSGIGEALYEKVKDYITV